MRAKVETAAIEPETRVERCQGSKKLPVSGSVQRPAHTDETGVCPVCGQRLRLGYALLLPKHDPSPAGSAKQAD